MNDLFTFLCGAADSLETMANLAIIFFVGRFFYNRMWVEVNLSCGTFKVQRKEINASNLTNLASQIFFEGGRLPNSVREEVISLTNPATKQVRKV